MSLSIAVKDAGYLADKIRDNLSELLKDVDRLEELVDEAYEEGVSDGSEE